MTGKEWFENGSEVSGLEIHQEGGGGTRRVRSSILEGGVYRYRIWAGGGQGHLVDTYTPTHTHTHF